MTPPSPAAQRTTSERLSGLRVALYSLATFWLGSVTNSQWRNWLDGYWTGVWSISAIAVALLVALALMVRHDVKRGRIGGDP